jgi:head-tail adaptor
MEAGKLDRLITIEQKSVTKDALGGEVITWTTYATAWAGYKGQRITEGVESDQVVASRIVEFTFRSLDAPAVDESMRISYDSGIYEIEGIKIIGRQETTQAFTKLKV